MENAGGTGRDMMDYVSIDEIIYGNKKAIEPEPIVIIDDPRTRRLHILQFV